MTQESNIQDFELFSQAVRFIINYAEDLQSIPASLSCILLDNPPQISHIS